MKTLLAAFVVFIGLQSCLVAQTVSITVTFDTGSGINGGNPVSLVSYKVGVQQSGLVSQAGGGGGAAKSQFTPMTLYKTVDQTTPQLFLACALGKVFKNATLTLAETGSNGTGTFFQIVLTNVIISSVNDDSTNSDGGIPLESISLSYSKIGWQFNPIGGSGALDSAFDVKKNISLPFNGLLPPQ